MAGAAHEFNEANFQTDVLESDVPVLVDFWAPWCGPCRRISPMIDELASEVENAKVGKVNVDENQSLAMQYSVQSIPTLLVFKGGEPVQRFNGPADKARLAEALA